MTFKTCTACGSALDVLERCPICMAEEEADLLGPPLTVGIDFAKDMADAFCLPSELLRAGAVMTATEMVERAAEARNVPLPPVTWRRLFPAWKYKTTMRQDWKKYHRARRCLASSIRADRTKIEALREWQASAPPSLFGNFERQIEEIQFRMIYPPVVIPDPRLGAAMVRNRRIKRYLP